jgi:hypothetical protein
VPASKPHRITGLPRGHVDTQLHQIHFDLSVSGNRAIPFVAKYGVATQIIGSLGRMLLELQAAVYVGKGMESSAAEEIRSSHVQKDRWNDSVIVQLTTPAGIPYTFAMPTRVAAGIADQLRIESSKPTEVGTA